MVHGSIDYNLEHLTRCHLVFFWSFCIIFCSFHNIIIHPEPFFAKKFGFFLLLCYRLGKQKQLLASGVANGVSINVRKLSSKTQVVCSLYHRSHACHKNIAIGLLKKTLKVRILPVLCTFFTQNHPSFPCLSKNNTRPLGI